MDHPFIELQSVDSTNFYAADLIKKKNVAEGTIIFAHEQTSGRGQGENKWESEPEKNVTFSLILRPVFLPPEHQFSVNKVITLGVLSFLRSLAINEKWSIKWPNDIYAGNRKIGGILIQNLIFGNTFEICITGIGININQELFSPNLSNPVSLKLLNGMNYDLKNVVDRIIAGIDELYSQLEVGFTEHLDSEYREQLFGLGEWRNYSVDKRVVKGMIKGVDKSGLLIMEMENGSVRHFNHGEFEFCL
jgi:BirA family biotin operon repressor/biotin-[acetyl-CoA-carboxylase] ligase